MVTTGRRPQTLLAGAMAVGLLLLSGAILLLFGAVLARVWGQLLVDLVRLEPFAWGAAGAVAFVWGLLFLHGRRDRRRAARP